MPLTTATLLCLVVAINDGDSFRARCGDVTRNEETSVAIRAIDAPEMRQAYGEMSHKTLVDLCLIPQKVKLTNLSVDVFGRTVADVDCQGKDAATEQLRTGMAWYDPKVGPGYEALAEVQLRAQAAGRGLWAQNSPLPPWDWRATRKKRP
jgi:endonuclease YncB( thermonuclease family)